MEYKATLDLASKIISAVVAVLFLGNAVYVGWILIEHDRNPTFLWITGLTTLLLWAVFAFCYLFRPLRYMVDKEKIIVRRPAKDLILNIREIKNAFLVTKESMRWTIRTFGNGGLFGYTGKFYNNTYGNMTWYATRRNNYTILVTVDEEKIVLTPDDIEMVEKIRKWI